MSHPSRACESLEPRRLLSADIPADLVEPDLPIADDTSDVVVADGREQIYPPLAPAMWMEEAVGSFEEPAEITVAFFGRDPVDEAPPEEHVPPPPSVVEGQRVASPPETRPAPIAREVLDGERDDPLGA